MAARLHLIVFMLAMLAGLVFASFSTYDFVQHLDRQVHDLHCSFVPGLAETARDEQSACQVTLMSPYSSVLRAQLWGGLPISLPAMGVFAFLLLRGVDVLSRPIEERRMATGVLFAMSTVPLGASLVMGTIAFVELGAACKLCIGIYGASMVGFLAAGLAYASARRGMQIPGSGAGRSLGVAVLQLGVFVTVPAALYVLLMPDYSRYVGTCGRLADTVDPYDVMVPMDDHGGGVELLEVLDPLCPTCRGFEHRLRASGLEDKLHRKVLLFPLDQECNWNVTTSLHPGACEISEAVLCAAQGGGPSAREVLDWAFDHQEELLAAAKNDATAPGKHVRAQFPALAACIGSPEVRSKLNKSLRWAVGHSLPVLTPQAYVDGVKLCGEDTDLGLEYTLHRLLEQGGHQ
jgi:hypothetical protein